MKKNIIIIIFMVVSNLCNSQSLEEDKFYATQFLNNMFLDNQLQTNVNKIGNSVIHILESNDNNQITRELNRLSDSTFLYTEFEPIHCEEYMTTYRNHHISKQGILVFSDDTILDTSVMWNPQLYEVYPSPRKRNVYRQTGEWFERYNGMKNMIKGSYNSKGKHGEWKYYCFKHELDKILTYENGKCTKEEYINYLNYKSIEKLSQIIQGTWSMYKNIFSTNFSENSSTYTFESDGTIVYTFKRIVDGETTGYTRKGTWSIPNFKTIVFTIHNRKRTLILEHLTDRRIRFKEEKQ